MPENFNSLFLYLEKEDIKVDKTEFLIQIHSHPNYPSILAVSDTLKFFNIQSGIIKVDFSEIELLPNRFLTILTEEDYTTRLYLIEKKGNKYFQTQDKKTIEINQKRLGNKWSSVVALVEKSEIENNIVKKKNNLTWILPILCLILFVSTLLIFDVSLKAQLFFIFPIIGILFSVAALKDLFGTKSEFINSFCNITATTSCSTIIESNKWKIFNLVNLSDLSVIFFTLQLASLFIFALLNNSIEFFYIQKIILITSIPVLFISVYYQKFVEKKWCPICLAIASIIVLELFYIIFTQDNNYNITFKSIIVFSFVFLAIVFIWYVLKNILTKLKELKEFQITGYKFMRNYEIFKNTLVSKDKIELPFSPIILGNKESETEITIITSPFCGHCKEAHNLLEKILKSNRNNLKIKIIFNANMDTLDEDKKSLFRGLISIYLEKGEDSFLNALNYWFHNKDLKDWLQIYNSIYDSEKIDSIYKNQNQWCVDNNLYLTPTIFINSYKYPKTYTRENIEYFVYELLEDNF
jgi:thiol-disulfide isomerase/thioredoxin